MQTVGEEFLYTESEPAFEHNDSSVHSFYVYVVCMLTLCGRKFYCLMHVCS